MHHTAYALDKTCFEFSQYYLELLLRNSSEKNPDMHFLMVVDIFTNTLLNFLLYIHGIQWLENKLCFQGKLSIQKTTGQHMAPHLFITPPPPLLLVQRERWNRRPAANMNFNAKSFTNYGRGGIELGC